MPSVVLRRDEITVRPLVRRDATGWLALRQRNRAWLEPWEATVPGGSRPQAMTFAAYVRSERTLWRKRRGFPMAIEVAGQLVGRVVVSGIEWGAERGGSIGYWIDQEFAGRGIVPRAVAMLADYAFAAGLHRLEIAVRPENNSSLAVVAKLGFRDEGLRPSYLYIDGDWRDHRVFALTASEPRIGPAWSTGS